MKRVVISMLLVVLLLAVVAIVFLPRAIREWRFHEARRVWNNWELDGYNWTIDTNCFGPCTNGIPMTIVIRHGDVVKTRTAHRDIADIAAPRTIDALFDKIEGMLDSDSVHISYDEEFGYPTVGSFDPDSQSIDEEWSFTASVSATVG